MKFDQTFSSFSVNDLKKAKAFYNGTLGLAVNEKGPGLNLQMNGNNVFIYEKPNHEPATFTVLNFHVGNIEQTVEELKKKGIAFEQYEGELKTDAKGIHTDEGMKVAWFRDPAGNYLSVIEGGM